MEVTGLRPRGARTLRLTQSLQTLHEQRKPSHPHPHPQRRVASARRQLVDTVAPTVSALQSPRSSQSPTSALPSPRRQAQRSAVPDGGSHPSSEMKRDSGIGTTDLPTVSLARHPDLPTILVVQDEDNSVVAAAQNPTDLSRDPFAKVSGVLPEEKLRAATQPPSPPARAVRRTMSFQDRPASIATTNGFPSHSTTAMDFDDLSSDKVTFSTRGSLLFGGKRMKELIAAKGDELNVLEAEEGTNTATEGGTLTPPHKVISRESIQEAPESRQDVNDEQQKQSLVAGKREPSIAMRQAALHGGRVLSTDENTFSHKVRSMYDYGDERAANWATPAPSARSTATPDTMDGDLDRQKIRYPASRKSSINADPRSSFYSKAASEVAGGIEDWGDIDGRHVDRYGFIHLDRPASRVSETSSSARQPGAGMQRIATSLRVETEQPRRERKLRRGPSSIRSSRSVPPSAGSGVTKKGPGSVHSTLSTSSSSRPNPFKSKSRRALEDASDMLTLPPGLANIEEDEDAGTTASTLKQREWSREEKWQKMAQPVALRTAGGKGGGMRFRFDTTDSKLVERTWKGIPDRWRATAWHSFLTTSAQKRGSPATDEELIGQFFKLQGISSADDIQIDVDVPRTINMHVMFRKRYRGGQRLLFRVLHAISLYFPETGYVQGMAALAVTLLCYYEEELAFVMMVRMWQLRGLDQLFESGFGGLMTCLKQFETEWLRGGDVAKKLDELGIDPTAWGTRWYLTLFNMSVPFPAQLRIWDVFMLLGDAPVVSKGSFGGADLDVLHGISAALIDATREILLDSDFENAMKVLTSFVPIKDEDLLMKVAKTEYKMKKKRDGVKG